MARRWLDEATAADLGRLDAAAIDRVRERSVAGGRRAPTSCTTRCSALGFVTDGEVARATNAGRRFVDDARERAARDARSTLPDAPSALGRRRTPAAVRRRSIPTRRGSRRSTRPRSSRDARGRARRRLPRSCAAVSRRSGPVTVGGARVDARRSRDARSTARSPRLPAKAWSMQGAFTPGARRRMVRSRAARAHPSLHGAAPARGDRAGRDAGLHALPVPLAARRFPASGAKGPDALDAVIAQLQGFEAPAAAWEVRDPAGAARQLRLHLARRPVPVGSRGVDAADAASERRGAAAPGRSARRR